MEWQAQLPDHPAAVSLRDPGSMFSSMRCLKASGPGFKTLWTARPPLTGAFQRFWLRNVSGPGNSGKFSIKAPLERKGPDVLLSHRRLLLLARRTEAQSQFPISLNQGSQRACFGLSIFDWHVCCKFLVPWY